MDAWFDQSCIHRIGYSETKKALWTYGPTDGYNWYKFGHTKRKMRVWVCDSVFGSFLLSPVIVALLFTGVCVCILLCVWFSPSLVIAALHGYLVIFGRACDCACVCARACQRMCVCFADPCHRGTAISLTSAARACVCLCVWVCVCDCVCVFCYPSSSHRCRCANTRRMQALLVSVRQMSF